jgi:phytoene desaturase
MSTTARGFDVVVIGSGFGGLAAAIRLRVSGRSVLLIDKSPVTGGRARQFIKDGYTFDAGPTVLTGRSMFEELFELCGEDYTDHSNLVSMSPFYRILGTENQSFDYYQDKDEFLTEVRRIEPGDVAGVDSVLKKFKKMHSVFFPYTEKPMLKFRVMLTMLPFLIRHSALLSVKTTVAHRVKNDFLRACLTFHPLLIGGNPARTPTLYGLIDHFERATGVDYSIGGTGRVIKALEELFLRQGGQIQLGQEVDEILVDHQRVVGVRLHSGEIIRTTVVVSNADSSFTYLKLLGDKYKSSLAGKFTTLLNKLRSPSMSLFVFYFGMKRSWPDTDLRHHSIIIPKDLGASLKQIFSRGGKVYSSASKFLYIHIPTKTDKTIAPANCDLLYVLVAAPALTPSQSMAEPTALVRKEVVQTLEKYLPGFEKEIHVEFSVDPTYFKDELNTPYGAAFSMQPTLMQSAWFRPHNRSPKITGLYFVGAGTHPGAGVPAVLASAKITTGLVNSDFPVKIPVAL